MFSLLSYRGLTAIFSSVHSGCFSSSVMCFPCPSNWSLMTKYGKNALFKMAVWLCKVKLLYQVGREYKSTFTFEFSVSFPHFSFSIQKRRSSACENCGLQYYIILCHLWIVVVYITSRHYQNYIYQSGGQVNIILIMARCDINPYCSQNGTIFFNISHTEENTKLMERI